MSRLSRVTRLAAVSLSVPDPGATAAFLHEALGFAVWSGSAGAVWHVTCEGEYGIPTPASVVSLHESDRYELNGVKFDVVEDDLGKLRDDLEAAGVRVRDSDQAAFGSHIGTSALTFADPNGLQICCGPAGPRFDGSLPPAPTRPRRLGHVNVKVPRPEVSSRFLADTLGLRLSEQIGDAFYFLRIGAEHHSFGFRPGIDRPSIHHISFELNGWENYRLIGDRMADLGHKVEYGPGRHGPGRNLFVYLRDPSSGLRLELFADMAYIEDEATYVAPRWELGDRGNTVNRWGPAPPQSFLDD